MCMMKPQATGFYSFGIRFDYLGCDGWNKSMGLMQGVDLECLTEE